MIIRAPTGLYKSVLPAKPSDAGNVTFTISSTDPPRPRLDFSKISVGIEQRRRRPTHQDEIAYRAALGELVYTISKASKAGETSNIQQFENGHVFDFADPVSLSEVEPMLVGPDTEFRHDTFSIDYGALGISGDDQAVLEQTSHQAQQLLATQLNIAKSNRSIAEATISEQQKSINNLNRLLASVLIITGAGVENDELVGIVTKLQADLAVAIAARDEAVQQANTYANEADALRTQLQQLTAILT